MNKNLLTSFIFVLVLVGIFVVIPNAKIEGIGDFFEKIITPLSGIIYNNPFPTVILLFTGMANYKKFKDKDPH